MKPLKTHLIRENAFTYSGNKPSLYWQKLVLSLGYLPVWVPDLLYGQGGRT